MKNEFTDQDVENFNKSPQAMKIKALRNTLFDIVDTAKDDGMTFGEIMTAINGVYIGICLSRGIDVDDFKKGIDLMNYHYKEICKEHDET
jgi:hypothetical protein